MIDIDTQIDDRIDRQTDTYIDTKRQVIDKQKDG